LTLPKYEDVPVKQLRTEFVFLAVAAAVLFAILLGLILALICPALCPCCQQAEKGEEKEGFTASLPLVVRDLVTCCSANRSNADRANQHVAADDVDYHRPRGR